MPKIKICGIRRIEDVNYVNKYMPEYIGFIFAESKRKVDCEQAKALGQGLDQRIKKVGVFVNAAVKNVVETAGECSLDAVQIHGDETPEYLKDLRTNLKGSRTEIWKAVRVKGEQCIKSLADYCADAYVLDAYVEGAYGGAGKTFDWNLALKASRYGKIILAGGLTPFNAWKATEVVNPFALDVSSGVETNGFKDEVKIREFINTVRSY